MGSTQSHHSILSTTTSTGSVTESTAGQPLHQRDLEQRHDVESDSVGVKTVAATTPINNDSIVKQQEQKLSGMALVNFKCRKRQQICNQCVTHFYTKSFLQGQSMDQEEICGDKFHAYQYCVLRGIQKENWEKEGYPPPGENSPLAELTEYQEKRRKKRQEKQQQQQQGAEQKMQR